jgi:hypothetical protein
MNIKQTTIEKNREMVIKLISENEYKKALELVTKYPFGGKNGGGFIICKTRLMGEYNIKENQLIDLNLYFYNLQIYYRYQYFVQHHLNYLLPLCTKVLQEEFLEAVSILVLLDHQSRYLIQ